MKKRNPKLKIYDNQIKKEFFLPGITTTKGSDWRAKIKEIDELGLERAAIFLTGLKKEERKELYGLLKETGLRTIPLVHLRGDMELWELDYLVQNYKIEVFNTHSKKKHPQLYDWSKYQGFICLENSSRFFAEEFFDEKELQEFPGICLDLAHLEHERRLSPKAFEKAKTILKKYPIVCNHISAITKLPRQDKNGNRWHNIHYLEELSQLNYLKNYPPNYFSQICAIELENSLKEQLRAIEYILSLRIKK